MVRGVLIFFLALFCAVFAVQSYNVLEVDKVQAFKAVNDAGFDVLKIGGVSFASCGIAPYRSKFSATSAKGLHIVGVMCGTWSGKLKVIVKEYHEFEPLKPPKISSGINIRFNGI